MKADPNEKRLNETKEQKIIHKEMLKTALNEKAVPKETGKKKS